MALATDTVTRMAIQHAWGWTPSQIARWHQVEREVVVQLIADGFPAKQLPQCAGCGVEFTPKNPGNLYCTDRCRERAGRRRKDERAPASVCARCGTEFRRAGGGRYCSRACRDGVTPRPDALVRPLPIPRDVPLRAGQMDDAVFWAELARERRRLDDLPQMDGDRYWRGGGGR